MNYKVSELEGALLDAAVAKAAGFPLDSDGDRLDERTSGGAPSPFHPSTDWQDGGPIVDRERIGFDWDGARWTAWYQSKLPNNTHDGPTPLIAAMRAYCASKFGEEVEL